MTRPRSRSNTATRVALGAVLLLTALVLPTVFASGGSAAPASAIGTPDATHSVSTARGASTAPSPPAAAPAECAAFAAGWSRLGAIDPAPDVAPSVQSPCYVGHDAPEMYFVSNASRSGSQVRFAVVLPPNGTTPASALSAFWMGMWVAGVPCSYGGASYLTVELLPPFDTEAGVPGSPFWTVRAPVWDLVPSGSCDPQCQNDTAFFTVGGVRSCEDDAVTLGMGNLTDVAGQFRPGDLLTVDLTSAGGGSKAVEALVNDTTDSSRDVAWTYQAPSTIVGTGVVTPLYSTASTVNGGWTGGLDVGFGWQNCPLPLDGTSFATSCNSYDGPVVNVSGAPELDSVTSWNTSTHGYTNRYPSVVTASSSGACSGLADVAPCADFTTYGGTGAYPTFGVQSVGGRAWFAYGPSASNERTVFGGGTQEFPANGSLSSAHDPTTVFSVGTSVGSNSVRFSVRAIDPNGVAAVTVGTWWCTTNATRVPLTFPTALSNSPVNTSYDGNWTVTVPTGAAGMTGPFYYSIQARSASGATTTPTLGTLVLISGGGGPCTASPPPAPGLAPSGVSPVGGGYTLLWNESSSAGVSNFTVTARPAGGGTTLNFPEGNVTSARVTGLTGNLSYVLKVIATNPAGLAASSAGVTAVATYYALAAPALNVTASSAWVNQTTVRISANATGGFPRFTFEIGFGDGSSAEVNTTSDQASAVHFYGSNYTGYARISVSIVDSVGDTALGPTAFVPVRATPLAVPATITGGHNFVDVRWAPPTLPPVNASAFNVTHYTVYWTTVASSAPYLTAPWPASAAVPGVTSIYEVSTNRSASLPAADGTTVYAQVVAWDKYGEGLLPAETTPGIEPVLSATSGPFLAGAISTDPGPGGAAPFVENFSTPFTTAQSSSLVNATYRFTGGTFVFATIAGGNGEFWANASTTFDRPGIYSVYLYALDSLSEFAIVETAVTVTPGPAPVVQVVVAPTPVWVNSSVGFSASASGGSGMYSFSWDLGDGSTAKGGNITYSYGVATTYIVTVTATDTVWGGTTLETVPVSVLPIPTVAIATTANGGPGTYRLSAIVSGGYGNFTYTWVFDDGTQGTGETVSHTWTSAGTYTVTLEATDGYGHNPTATTILVVGASSTTSPSSSGEVSLDVAYLLAAAIVVLAALVVLLLWRSRRPPPEPAGEPLYGDEGGPGTDEGAVPDANYEEEPPPGI